MRKVAEEASNSAPDHRAHVSVHNLFVAGNFRTLLHRVGDLIQGLDEV